MEVKRRTQGDIERLDVIGDFIAPECDTLVSAVNDLLARGARSILISLSNVQFLDLAGMKQLAVCAERVRDCEGRVAISEGGLSSRAVVDWPLDFPFNLLFLNDTQAWEHLASQPSPFSPGGQSGNTAV